MAIPNGITDIKVGSFPFLVSAHDNGDTSVSDLAAQDEDKVRAAFKAFLLGDATSVLVDPDKPLAKVFDGLPGLPGVVQRLVQKVTGDTGATGPIGTLLDHVGTFFGNLRGSVFDGIDFLDGGFDGPTAISNFIDNLTPSGKLAQLVSGKLKAGQEPQMTLDNQTALGQIGDILQGVVVTPIDTAVSNVKDWFQGLLNWQSDREVNEVNTQNFQIGSVATPPRRSAHESPEPISDITYPISMHLNQKTGGNTGPASTGTAHTHTSGDLTTGTTLRGIPQDNTVGAYITITYPVVMDSVGWIGSKDTAVNSVFLEVFREQADKSLAQVFSIDITADIDATDAWRTHDLPAALPCQMGERYVVRLHNKSSAGGFVWFMGQDWGQFGPDISHNTNTSTLSNKTSYTTTEAGTANGTAAIGWFMLAARNLTQTDQSFSDDFNRSTLGGLWVQASNTGSNQARISQNQLAFGGATNGWQEIVYTRRCGGDANRVEGDLDITALGAAPAGLQLHCDREGTQRVFLAVNSDGAKIYSGSPSSLTQRATHGTGGGGHWAIWYDEDNDQYLVEKDGDATGLAWTGVSTTVTHGENFRFGGVRIERSLLVNGGKVDNWTLRDYAPAA